MQLEGRLRVLDRARPGGDGQHVTRPLDELGAASVEGPRWIREPLDRVVEVRLERSPRAVELRLGRRVGEPGKLGMVDRVRADLDPAPLERG